MAAAPGSLPRWLRSDALPWAGLLLALTLVLGLAAFVRYERLEIESDVQGRAELYARVLEDQTARLIGGAELALQTLAPALESEPAAPPHVDNLLAATVRGLPFVRSISWLDAEGRVRASSQPGARGWQLPRAAITAGPGGLAPLQPARDLAQMARGERAPAGVAVLPLTWPLPGDAGLLVALISTDFVANQQQLTLSGTHFDGALLAYEGTLVAATDQLRALPGSRQSQLDLFTRHLPDHESGVEAARGLDDVDGLLAWRSVRRAPLVVLVQTPHATVDVRLAEVRHGALIGGALALALIAALTTLAWRSLRGHELVSADLRQARGTLAAQDAFTDRLFEVSPVPMAVQDAQGRFVRVNRAWCEFTGRDAAALLGQQATPALGEDTAAALAPSLGAGLLQRGSAAQHETQLRDGRGLLRDVVVRHMAFADPGGHAGGTITCLVDVSEFREAERRTREAKEAAEQANAAKGEFIANVSHELRTPLQSILGFSELGCDRAAANSREQQMFSMVHAGGERMLTLVEALLDLSQLEATFGRSELAVIDLVPTVRAVVAELAPLAASRSIQLALPDDQLPLLVHGDSFRLQQVLRNVLANALRFAPAGSVIDTCWSRQGDDLVLRVRDHGPGIPPDELESIFEPFTQSTRTKDGSGGTGLGLAICRKIMAAHRGRIIAMNAEGGGALFEIRLPAL
ncbi:PAS domain S-box protein [Ideonella sp. 4Y11]|uniref:histidine kinase n=1 Tax=Ideonella aquatica TaxID=2824119 RepID=A0A941BLW4_9BURK|nr:sensor histidine kinase [Ideonella aquatica]MBQ0961827.1 PAS domain S-box protein [Ideonella aquatica]